MDSHSLSLSLAFLGGVGASVTPCVYPLIPVTLAIFGATSEVSRLRAFLLSCSYVAGIAVTYTALGILSAVTGSLFGEALRNPLVLTLLALCLIALALYTIDIIQFEGAYRLQSKASLIGGRGYSGAFLMGTVSGIVAAPCAGPLLIAILSLAAASQSLLWSATLLFSYSLGFGLIFLVLGTFSGLLRKLPRSGDWFYIVKLLIAAALFTYSFSLLFPFVRGFVPQPPALPALLAAALFLLSLLAAYYRPRPAIRLIAALLIAFTLTPQFLSPPQAMPRPTERWQTSLVPALNQGRPIMIDFFAEWCAACKEFESITFPDSRVSQALKSFSLTRIDMTSPDKEADQLAQRYEILGLPTLLFLCADGSEIRGTRVEGFKAPAEFLTHLMLVGERAGSLCKKMRGEG